MVLSVIWPDGYYLNTSEICVSINMQRSGLGRELMRVLQLELMKKGISRIYLITQRKTVPEKFYKSLDFATNDSLIIMGKSIEENN
jgi:N-acetylglutamate synthase-like GNAT family acetyltransferase